MAIASLILGILALGGSFIPFINNASIIFGIIGAIFAIISLIKKKSKGMAIAGLILSVLAVIISFSLQDEWSKNLDELGKDLDGGNTEKILKNDVDVTLGELQVVTDEYGYSETKLPVTVTNKAKEKKSYSIKIEAVDANGNRISDDTVYADSLGAGQTQEFKAFEYVEQEKLESIKTATFKIVEVSKM